VLIALTYAETWYVWSSWHTLLRLIIEFMSFLLLSWFESSRFAPMMPVMPHPIFASRTAIIVALNTFLSTAFIYWSIFFLPVYFQSVKLYSPTTAGIDTMRISLLGVPTAAAEATAMSL
jgi:hypothetical protein